MARGAPPPDIAPRRAAAAPGGELRGFVVQYDGHCATCPAPITPGDRAFYAPGSDTPSGMDCCGDRPDDELLPTVRGDEGLSVDDEDPAVTIARTLPRGKTAADACRGCWQIPASNGTCGCHT